MIKKLLKNWLGITKIENDLWAEAAKATDTRLNSEILTSRMIEPGITVHPNLEQTITEKPITKGYVKS